jgi:hypothetical protein
VDAYAPTTSYLAPATSVWLGVSDADTEGWFYFTAGRGTTAMAEVGPAGWRMRRRASGRWTAAGLTRALCGEGREAGRPQQCDALRGQGV